MTLAEADELGDLISAAMQAARTVERLVSRSDPDWKDAFDAEMETRRALFGWIGAHTCSGKANR